MGSAIRRDCSGLVGYSGWVDSVLVIGLIVAGLYIYPYEMSLPDNDSILLSFAIRVIRRVSSG